MKCGLVTFVILSLFFALLLSLLTTVSLPSITSLDIVRVYYGDSVTRDSNGQNLGISEIRFGVWAPCFYDDSKKRTCLKARNAQGGQGLWGYNVTLSNDESSGNITISNSRARDLSIQPLSIVAPGIAFGFVCSKYKRAAILVSFAAFLASTAVLAMNLAFWTFIRDQVHKLPNIPGKVVAGPGLWLVLASVILMFLVPWALLFHRLGESSKKFQDNKISR